MEQRRPEASPHYLRVVLGGWRVIAAATFLCVGIAALVTLIKPRTYESSVTLLVYPPVFKEMISQNPEGLAELMPRTLPVETYKTIALSKELLGAVLQKLQDDQELEIDNLTAEDLEDKCSAELTSLGSKTPQYGIRYSQTIIFRATANNPTLAAKLAQTWAELFKERVDELTLGGLDEMYGVVESMWEKAKKDLEDAEDKREAFMKQWNLELLRLRLTEMQVQLTEFERHLVQLEIDIARQEASLRSLQAELVKERKIETLFKAPPDEVFWLARQEPATGKGESIGPETGFRTEYLNPNFTVYRDKEIDSVSTLKGLEIERDKTRTRIETLQVDVDRLQEQIVGHETEETRLSRTVTILETTYLLVGKSLEKGKIAQINKTSDIQIAGRAIKPERPEGPGRAMNLALATCIGVLLGIGYVVVEYSLRVGLGAVTGRVEG